MGNKRGRPSNKDKDKENKEVETKVKINENKKTEIKVENIQEKQDDIKSKDGKEKKNEQKIPLTSNVYSKLFSKSKTEYVLYTGVITGKGFDIFRTTKLKAGTNCIVIDNKKDSDKDYGYPFDIQKDVFHLDNTYYYMLDINVGQLTLNGKDKPDFNPVLLAKLVKDKVIAQYTTRLTEQQKKASIMIGVFGIILGSILGFLVGKWNVLFPAS